MTNAFHLSFSLSLFLSHYISRFLFLSLCIITCCTLSLILQQSWSIFVHPGSMAPHLSVDGITEPRQHYGRHDCLKVKYTRHIYDSINLFRPLISDDTHFRNGGERMFSKEIGRLMAAVLTISKLDFVSAHRLSEKFLCSRFRWLIFVSISAMILPRNIVLRCTTNTYTNRDSLSYSNFELSIFGENFFENKMFLDLYIGKFWGQNKWNLFFMAYCCVLIKNEFIIHKFPFIVSSSLFNRTS